MSIVLTLIKESSLCDWKPLIGPNEENKRLCDAPFQPVHLQHDSYAKDSWIIVEEEMEMLYELVEQEIFLEIVFPRNAREATLITFYQPGCLKKTWTMVTPIDMLTQFSRLFSIVQIHKMLCLKLLPLWKKIIIIGYIWEIYVIYTLHTYIPLSNKTTQFI